MFSIVHTVSKCTMHINVLSCVFYSICIDK